MRCNICDRALTEKEISLHPATKQFEPCTTCLEIAFDAAYCDGFDTEDDAFVLLDEDDKPFLDYELVVYRNIVSDGYYYDEHD
jgi:hypothetical protein